MYFQRTPRAETEPMLGILGGEESGYRTQEASVASLQFKATLAILKGNLSVIRLSLGAADWRQKYAQADHGWVRASP